MIRSMTGFGKGTSKGKAGDITAEIKTLNHKSLGISCTPFNDFFLLDEKVAKVLGKKIFRGKVFVKISRESAAGQKSVQKITVNEDKAAKYLAKIKKIQKKLGVKGEIRIQDIINFPGIVEVKVEKKKENLWPDINKALNKALIQLMEYRSKEGVRLAKDFNKRLITIKKNLVTVKKAEKQCVSEYRKKLTASIREMAIKPDIDKGKLETEVALFARNCDIAEEVTRLESNITAYKDTMKNKETYAGKKLDFIAQEMQREVNTIGAKSSDHRISKAVIEMKSEIEKIREQIKNIE